MPIHERKALRIAEEAFRQKLIWLRERRGLSQEALADAVKRKGGTLAQKSVSNLEKLAHESKLASYVEIAEELGVPLWVMFIPGLDFGFLEKPRLQRLVSLVNDYCACADEQRVFVEKMAAGYAGLNPKK